MKTHDCPVELAPITFHKKCNWCGEQEFQELTEREVLDLFNVENLNSIDARIYLTAYSKIEAKLKEKNK